MILDAYIRASTEEQKITLTAQESRIRQYHALYGRREGTEWELGLVLVEEGVSAKTLHRPELEIALDRMDRFASDGIIVAKLDRLTRDLGDWQRLVSHYFGEKAGRKLIAVDNEVNTFTATGRMMLNMIVLMAQWKRETISERTVGGLRDMQSRNERTGSVRFGFELDASNPARSKSSDSPIGLKEAPEEQIALGLMKDLRKQGASYRRIAAELKARGFRTKYGNQDWHANAVRRIIDRSIRL